MDNPVSPEKIVLKGGGLTRRNSTGSLSISKKRVKVLPRYLRGSMGSCHNFCKHGIKPILKKKARNPKATRITASPNEHQDEAGCINLEVNKKKSVIIVKQADSMSQTRQVIEKQTPVLSKNVVASSKPFISPCDKVNVSRKHVESKSASFSVRGRLSSRRYSEILPHKAIGGLLVSPVGVSSSGRHNDVCTSKEMMISKLRKKKDLLPPTVSPPPGPSIKGELNSKSGQGKDPKQGSNLKSPNRVRKAEVLNPENP